MIWALFKRELASYFSTPLALIFINIFLILAGGLTFYVGGFYQGGQADLQSFFFFQPWLYVFLVPAICMRLWAEERKAGTIELLLTLPVTMWQAVLAKFLAAWCFLALALALTFPIWVTVNYLGDPDNGVILAGYIGSILMGGAYLAIGGCISASTKSQVIAFIVAFFVLLSLVLLGFGPFQNIFSDWAPNWLMEAIGALSPMSHFQAIGKGVLDMRDLIYFVAVTLAGLAATAIVIELKKAD